METKRLYERIEVEIPIRLFVPGDGKPTELKFEAFAKSRNLSLGGVFVESTFLLKPGLELHVELFLPSEALTVKGRVVHVISLEHHQFDSGMGIEFLEVGTHGREVLLRYFAPDNYREFYGLMVKEFAHLQKDFSIDDVSLVLNLWEEWKVRTAGGPWATQSGAPEALPKTKKRRGQTS